MRWMNIFLPENVRHLAVARGHSSTAGVELPPALAGGVSRILLWRKLAVGETTSLYMKAVALARVPVPITPIQAMSISMWAGMEGRGDKSCTFSWVHMYLHVQSYFSSIVFLAASSCEGIDVFPNRGFEDEAKSQQRDWKAKRKCHCYLVSLQRTDSSQTCFSFQNK